VLINANTVRLILFKATKFLIIFKKISPFLSHSRQRKDKICLNCNAEIYGRYCHQCGQENIEPKETAWGLVTHFFYDITHFDGKFFSSLRYLILKPGFLSKEYIRGRRASYLHPIRMYVFTSAFFFIIFFSQYKVKDLNLKSTSTVNGDSLVTALAKREATALKQARTKADSQRISNVIREIVEANKNRISDSVTEKGVKTGVSVKGVKYPTVQAYDSAQRLLPEEKRDGWYQRFKNQRRIAFKQRIDKDPDHFLSTWLDELLHKFPQLLFVSLPLFALLLKLLYIRRRQFYYADHAIFAIHLYIFTFISLFILLMLNQLREKMHWNWVGYPAGALFLYMIYYTYRAMKNFYMQGAFKTFVKFSLLNILSFFMILFLFVVFIVLSIYEI
jgi:hypothetical protein